MARFDNWLNLWQRGALALVFMVLSVVAVGLLIAVPVLLLFELVGLSEVDLWLWLPLSALVWGPPVVAKALRYVPADMTKPSG